MSVELLESDSKIFRVQRTIEAQHLPVTICDCGPNSINKVGYLSLKYCFDKVVGWAGLILLGPLIAALGCAVRMASPGPAFYRQCRVGLNGRVFTIVKLRTMYCDAEAKGIAWSKKGDSRVTPLGRILRRLHLDELPQLWNVACGDMSLVGPRPERPEIIRTLERIIPGYHQRHQIKPGVTGLSQINIEPDHNINITRRKQILDLRYINSASPWLDAKMIGITILRLVGIKGNAVIEFAGLKQEICDQELMAIGYQFDTPESELWSPGNA